MIRTILTYLAASALFLAGFFCCAFLSSTRIKMETERADFFEHKWNDLVEITSTHTDQTKDKERP